MQKELKQQALINLLSKGKIDIWESISPDAVPGDDKQWEVNLKAIGNQIKEAVIDDDHCALGKVLMNLITEYQADSIAQEAELIESLTKQDLDDLNGVSYMLPQHAQMQEAGVAHRDFY